MVKDLANQLICDIRSKLNEKNVSSPLFTDKFIIRCFRCKTIKLIENYEKTLNQLSKLRTKYQLLDLIDTGIFRILDARGVNDEKILYFDIRKWKPREILFKHVCTSFAIFLDYLMLNEKAEKQGIIVLINFENFGLNKLLSIRKPFITKLVKVIDGHLPFNIHKVIVINLNLTGRFFWSSVIRFFSSDFIAKLQLYGRDLKDIGNFIDEKALTEHLSDSNKEIEIDFKQDFASKVFDFPYKYEEDQD